MKPTIPNDVADVIEMVRKEKPNWPNEWIIECWFMQRGSDDVVRTIRKISLNLLMAALVNGYERELTEEQKHAKIAQEYAEYVRGAGHYGTLDEDAIYADGIRFTLDTLGIQIEGVNA